MKLLFYLISLIAFWLPQAVLAQVRCETIFVTQTNLGEFGVNAKVMAPYYISMFRDTQAAAGVTSPGGLLTKDIFNASSTKFATVVTRFKARNSKPSTDSIFKDHVQENIDFVLKSYTARRDWSLKLRDHLHKEAEHYAEQSTYIEVRRLDDETFTPEELIGTMKVVEVTAKTLEKKLPLEADFSVTMPNNAGRKFEPANFVVDKDQNKLGTSEIFTQLILHAREQLQNPKHEPNKMMYYTPADRLGMKMYGKLGFIAVPGFENPIKEGMKDWWMIGSTAENLAQLPERLAKNKAQWHPEDIEWMSQLVKNFENLQGTKAEIEGVRSKNLQVRKGSVKEVGVFLTEPFTHQGKNFRRLSILSMSGGGIEINLRLPVESFPLKNGWRMDQKAIHLIYQDGIFKLYDTLFKTRMDIKTDGAFKKPEYLHFHDHRNDISAAFVF